jgi:hypothetical protein
VCARSELESACEVRGSQVIQSAKPYYPLPLTPPTKKGQLVWRVMPSTRYRCFGECRPLVTEVNFGNVLP